MNTDLLGGAASVWRITCDARVRGSTITEIPNQLHGCRFILVQPKGKRAIERDWQGEANYAHDDPRLLRHVRDGGNYGVMPFDGVCILDVDNSRRLGAEPIEPFLDSFIVRTGRDGGGMHIYFRCYDLPPEKFILQDADGNDLGDIRGNGHPSYVVGPGSTHPSGNRYEVINADGVADIPLAVVQAVIDTFPTHREMGAIDWQRVKKASAGGTITDRLRLSVIDFLMPDNPRHRNGEIEGAHPVHGSETGTNLTVKHDVWYCRRHGTGGGPLEALAVAEGIIRCEDAASGCLDGHWHEVFDALKARGYAKQLWLMGAARKRQQREARRCRS